MKRILLVTEKCSVHTLPLLLAHAGYDVLEPRVPSEAPKIVETTLLDLVVVGHCVPKQKREVLAELIHRSNPQLPIVCVTDNPVEERPTPGAMFMASCSSLMWAIEKAASLNEARKASAKKP